jgi:nucleoid-associated protein YgaU
MSRYSDLDKYFAYDKNILLSSKEFNLQIFRNLPHTFYSVQQNDTLDAIAYNYYDGHGEYWWIICMANNLSLPTDIYPGMVLLISLDYKSVLNTLSLYNKN